jgi:hypothetical protein
MKKCIILIALLISTVTICKAGQKFDLNRGIPSKPFITDGISSFQENVLRANSDEYYEYDTTESYFNDYLPREIAFGLTGFQFDYKEEIDPPKKSTEVGFIPGGYIATTTNRNYPFFLNLGLQFAKANETYDGSTQTGEPYVGTTNSSYWKIDFGANYQFIVNDNFAIVPFVHYSYRVWDRNIEEGKPAGIEEIYSWNNLPIGCKFIIKPVPEFSIGLSGNVNIMMSGKIKILFSKISAGAPDITLDLNTTPSYTINIDLRYRLNEKWTLTLNPYYENYEFVKSDPYMYQGEPLFYEPSSRTYVYGASIGVILGL